MPLDETQFKHRSSRKQRDRHATAGRLARQCHWTHSTCRNHHAVNHAERVPRASKANAAILQPALAHVKTAHARKIPIVVRPPSRMTRLHKSPRNQVGPKPLHAGRPMRAQNPNIRAAIGKVQLRRMHTRTRRLRKRALGARLAHLHRANSMQSTTPPQEPAPNVRLRD